MRVENVTSHERRLLYAFLSSLFFKIARRTGLTDGYERENVQFSRKKNHESIRFLNKIIHSKWNVLFALIESLVIWDSVCTIAYGVVFYRRDALARVASVDFERRNNSSSCSDCRALCMRDVQLVSSRCYCWHEYLLPGKMALAPDLVSINIYVGTYYSDGLDCKCDVCESLFR